MLQFPLQDAVPGPSAPVVNSVADDNDVIMRALLAHEKKSTAVNVPVSENESDTSEEDADNKQTATGKKC